MPKRSVSSGITGLTTIYPGTVRIDFTVANTGLVSYSFAVVALVGRNSVGKWYGEGYYNDGKSGTCVPAGKPQGNYVCMSLNPGQNGSDFRTLNIPNDPDVKDAMVIVKDPNRLDAAPDYGTLDSDLLENVITVPTEISATIKIDSVS